MAHYEIHQSKLFTCAGAATVLFLALSIHPMVRSAGADTFTWQGKLVDGGQDAAGIFDFQFALWDASSGGGQIGATLIIDDVSIDEGLVTIDLDFGAGAFDGGNRWLEIDVKPDAAGVYTTLNPRQPVHPTPYALHAFDAANATTATNATTADTATEATNLNGQPASFYTDAANLSSGVLGSARLAGTYGNAVQFSNPGNSFLGDGSQLTNLKWANLINVPAGFADGTDNDTTYAAASPLQIAGNTLSLSGSGASAGDVLKWNGAQAQWSPDNDTSYVAGAGLNLIGTTFSLDAHSHAASDISSGNLLSSRLPLGGSWALSSELSIDNGTLQIDPNANRIGIGQVNPAVKLHVEGGTSATLFGGGFMQLGPTSGPNLAFDGTSLLARNNTLTAPLRINDAGGNVYIGANQEFTGATMVGIGTDDARTLVHIEGPNHGTDGPIIKLQGSGANQDESGRVRFTENDSFWGMYIGYDGNTNLMHLGGHPALDSSTASDFPYLSIERDTGRVGIGTQDPDSLLHVNGVIRTTAGLPGEPTMYFDGDVLFTTTDYTMNFGRDLDLNTGRDLTIAPQQNLMVDVPGSSTVDLGGTGTVSADTINLDASVFDVDAGSWIDLNTSGNFLLASDNVVVNSTTTGVGVTNPSDRLHVRSSVGQNALRVQVDTTTAFRVYSNLGVSVGSNAGSVPASGMYVAGNVGIGTTAPAFTLHVNGTAGKPGGGLWGVASDRRLKKNISPLAGALDRVLKLRGVTYEYIDPDSIGELDGRHMGLIAQDVEQVFPEWVSEGDDGYKRVSETGITALFAEAMQELREEKDSEIAQLRGELESMRELMNELLRETKQANRQEQSR